MSKTNGALAGIKVLSFGQLAQAPAAVMHLADLGADVIKIEQPQKGAFERGYFGLNIDFNGESLLYLGLNRNQRSLTLNLKSDEGREIFLRLVKDADVLIENYRPGVMDRLGVGYDKLKVINPGLIYASASGYGDSGPYLHKPGQDVLAQAVGGLASVTGMAGDLPTCAGAAVVDFHSAALLSFGVVTALFHRERTGKGQKVQVNLLESCIDLQADSIVYFINGGEEKLKRSKTGAATPISGAPFGIYECKGGAHLTLSLVSPDKMGQLFGMEEYAKTLTVEDMFDKRDEIIAELRPIIKMRTLDEWLEILEKEDVWCSRTNTYADLIEDPQVKHNEVIQEITRADIGAFKALACPVKFSETKAEITLPPPTLGQHSVEILKSIGYADDEIKQYRDSGII